MAFKDAVKMRGLYMAEVSSRIQVSPHIVRVTVAGEDLKKLPCHGFDQWFRLFLPCGEAGTDFSRVPEQLNIGTFLKWLAAPSGKRPVFRSYTVREFRPELGEVDIDFVVHGDAGVAGPWAAKARAGAKVALLDQGRGFEPLSDAGFHLLVGEESAMPGIIGILRDLPRDARGLAIIEVPEEADIQGVDAPHNVEVRWLTRDGSGEIPGAKALEELRTVIPSQPSLVSAYVVGEQRLATQGRRHLVSAGVPKARIVFTGFWKADWRDL